MGRISAGAYGSLAKFAAKSKEPAAVCALATGFLAGRPHRFPRSPACIRAAQFWRGASTFLIAGQELNGALLRWTGAAPSRTMTGAGCSRLSMPWRFAETVGLHVKDWSNV